MMRNKFPVYKIFKARLSITLLALFILFLGHGQETDCKAILELSAENSNFSSPVFSCEDTWGKKFFKGKIKTDVCSDSLCELMELNIIWDLAGNYTKIDTIPGLPLTKFDHKPFSTDDYTKLHQILKNRNSLLGFRSKKELIDNTVSDYSKKVDGVSGATTKEVKSAVVEGAVYSTYTLWHLVNGAAVEQLKDHTDLNYDSNVQNQLLNSKNPKTIIYVLRKFREEDYEANFEKLIDIMKMRIPMINFYIAKKFPKNLFLTEKHVNSLREIWNQLDKNTQSVLAKNISQHD